VTLSILTRIANAEVCYSECRFGLDLEQECFEEKIKRSFTVEILTVRRFVNTYPGRHFVSVSDPKLVCPDLLRVAVLAQEEHPSSRPQDSKHFHLFQQTSQVGRFRNFKNTQVR
jgi:hypothetical protein